jgi:ketosteroid isomerase-like protein
MNRIVAMLSLLVLGCPVMTLAGPKEDVAAATQAWIGKTLPTFPPEFKVLLGEQRIRVFGDIAINTGTYSFSNVRAGKPTNLPARFSFVYRNRDGRWLIVDHHSSAVPAPPQ